ncbi:DUF167 domain-containing protein [Patescibacteria group bacterium]|nr:DUF167 domain-containing protein [Patescibacteria group bacterium]MBU1501018.1 DUF167 domain-containing protein [Patescibacteria group bacterium]MBU2080648.1 DUF167 domain-containing protein [Patescibacteria group bacterium]MBU2124277.1 DUF167 domain-containing protein [Patescibacteria group bacterium]MBU2194403.1 DUF167 domain-containing protein [Patescibacteria group bacterium]
MYIHARVTAGVRKESFEEVSPDHFLISVREKPERNEANRAVCERIALHFKVPPSKVQIVNGHQSPSKLLSVRL